MDRRLFANPPTEYRPVPFWSWNDRLEEQRLQNQLESFAQVGMGGVFMHARPGIWTPFLSPAWFEAVATTVSFAQKSGVKAWVYDESSFPSGFAGGIVLEKRPDLAQKSLVCEVVDARSSRRSGSVVEELGVFHVTDSGYSLSEPSETSHRTTVLRFFVKTGEPSAWLNGFPYPDLLDPESAAVFLETAYVPYKERFGFQLGGAIPGVFTDEPHIRPERVPGASTLPWTPELATLYKEQYGDDLLGRLPELFLDVGDFGVTRCRYWRLVTQRFISAWMRPMYEWCDQNRLQFTGHLWEHVFSPLHSGSIMAPLEYMHIPGLDLLGRDVLGSRQPQDGVVPPQLGNVHMVKAVSSVAHQLGRERVLSETYGGGGWDLSFETQKQYAEWEYALGVNFLNQHLSHYSLRGYRKHDFPISFQSHQPWWPEYRALGDYFGRLSYALSQGRFEAELLVLHPMASVWMEYKSSPPSLPPAVNRGDSRRLDWMETSLDHLLKSLAAANWGFDLGDDLILERHARVDEAEGVAVLQVGSMRYRAVVLPPCTNLLSPTLRLLEDFLAAGGRVYALAPTPSHLDGSPNDLRSVLGRCTILHSLPQLFGSLEREEGLGRLCRSVRTASSTVENPIYHLVRKVDDGEIVFLTNQGRSPHMAERVWLRGNGDVQRWDLSTGRVEALPTTPFSGGLAAILDFAPAESHLLFVGQRSSDTATSLEARTRHLVPTALGRHLPSKVQESCVLDGTWAFRRLDPNVLVLDVCEYRVGDSPWSGRLFTSQVGQQLLRRYCYSAVPYRDVQPWRKHPDGRARQFSEEITFRYRVQSEIENPGELELVVEDAESFSIAVNGTAVSAAQGTSTWLDDPAFRRVPVAPCWQKGENIIELRFCFHADLPVEPIFLVGDFALATADGKEFRLVSEVDMLHSGSWVDQGHPFFVGRGRYSQMFTLSAAQAQQPVWLELSDLPNLTRVYCNNIDGGLIAWPPYRLDLTGLVREGTNRLELQVANSLHNALGPHHRVTTGVIVSPSDFSYSREWTADYRLMPDGLARKASLLFSGR